MFLCTEPSRDFFSLLTSNQNESKLCEHTFCGGAVAFVIVADLSAGIILDSVCREMEKKNGKKTKEQTISVNSTCLR